jgi:hypothetical protein
MSGQPAIQAFCVRALNLLSHGKYSLYEPVEMADDNKQLFRDILGAFLAKHVFDLSVLLSEAAPSGSAVPVTVSMTTARPESVS